MLSHKISNQSIIEFIYPEVSLYLSRDLELLNNKKFNWKDVDIGTINERTDLLIFFNQFIPSMTISILNTLSFEQLFPLKFIDLITECPNNWFGEVIYNRSLDFYTNILDFFIRFYLEKDLRFLDKLESEDISTYNPLVRETVRLRNRNNEGIRYKYFNDMFNLKAFIIKLIDKFIISATWRWIGSTHKAHIFTMKICKIIVEYQLINEFEFEDIKNALYLKTSAFKSLENAIKKDSMHMDQNIMSIWKEGLTSLREYYAEIILQYCYMKLDKEVMRIIDNNGEKNGKSKDFTDFTIILLENNEISYKLREILFGYLLSQNTIFHLNHEEFLLSRRTICIVSHLLQILTNLDDPYMKSLKLITENCYFTYKNSLKNEKNKIFNDFSKEFSKIILRTSMGGYQYQEEVFIENMSDLMERLIKEMNLYKINEIQEILNFYSIPMKVFCIFGVYVEFSIEFKKLHPKTLFSYFSTFMKLFLKDNFLNYSTFFCEANIWSLENMFYKFPAEISELLLSIFKEKQNFFIAKEFILDVIIEILNNFLNKPEYDTLGNEKYGVLRNILEIFSIFVKEKDNWKIFAWIPEFDLRISAEIAKSEGLYKVEMIENLLKEENSLKCNESLIINNENYQQIRYFQSLLDLIVLSIEHRVAEITTENLKMFFPKQTLLDLLDLCRSERLYLKKSDNFKKILYFLHKFLN